MTDLYALIEAGAVIRWGRLPRTWGTVSRFDLADPATHRAAGWLPVIDDRPEPIEGHHWGEHRWVIETDRAILTCDLMPDPPEPAPTAAEKLAALPPEAADAMVTLALGIAGDAGDLWDALDAMTPDSDARPAVEIVTHHALEAGLALLETDPQETPE